LSDYVFKACRREKKGKERMSRLNIHHTNNRHSPPLFCTTRALTDRIRIVKSTLFCCYLFSGFDDLFVCVWLRCSPWAAKCRQKIMDSVSWTYGFRVPRYKELLVLGTHDRASKFCTPMLPPSPSRRTVFSTRQVTVSTTVSYRSV